MNREIKLTYISKIVAHIIFALKDALMRVRTFSCFASSSRYVTAPGSAIPYAPLRELTEPSPTSALAIAYFIVRII